MPKLSPELLRAIWERAQTEEIGISIPATDPILFRHKLIMARDSWADKEAFTNLMTFCPEGIKEVFIVRKTTEIPDAPPFP